MYACASELPNKIRILYICLLSIQIVSANFCKFQVNMKQNLLESGFHGNITYGIALNSEDHFDKWFYNDCLIGLYQTFPEGLFINPDELSDLRRLNKLTAIPKNRVDLEATAEQATPCSVYIIEKIRENQAYLWLPVHARYHYGTPGGGTANNIIDPPKLYLRCPDQRLEICDKVSLSDLNFLCNGSSKKTCSWREIPFTSISNQLIWSVPVGNTDHFFFITVGTATVITVTSLYLLKIIHEYKMGSKIKKL